MKGGTMNFRTRGIAAVFAAFLAIGSPAGAGAVTTTDYHPAANAREFRTGPGGWQSSSTSEGVCVQSLTCPTITNSWIDTGGTGGGADGFVRTAIENLAGAESTSRGIWESPAFVYRGAAGSTPTDVTFELARRTDLSPLLSTSGNSAHYSVELVDVDSGVALTVIDTAPLGASTGWARTREVAIRPSSLELGKTYSIRITSTFDTEAEAFPTSNVDYDSVRLQAVDSGGASGGGGSGGGGGAGGGGGHGGAVLHGNHLFLRLQCLGVARHGRCKVRAVAYSKRGKRGARMTFPIERRVNAKRGKKVTLRVRPRFVKQLSNRKSVLVRSELKAGDRRKVRFRRYKLS
jgi:hypothetical protein